MSGSLMPSIPEQLLLKYNPPKITVVYYFENNKTEKFYHDIFIDKKMIDTMTEDDLCSHLYLSEAYYFNPK